MRDFFLVSSVRIHLPQGVHLLGRGDHCTITIPEHTVSRQHARFNVSADGIVLSDLGSRNGSFVNGKRVAQVAIQSKDTLQFGSVTFELIDQAAISEYDDENTDEGILQSSASRAAVSPAQNRVLELLLCGLSEKQAASELKISKHTIHNHVRAIYIAMKVQSRAELLSLFVAAKPGRGWQ